MHQENVKHIVAKYITKDVLKKPDFPLDYDASLLRSGIIDSFAILDIALFVENTFGVALTDAELEPENLDTVTLIAQLVTRKIS